MSEIIKIENFSLWYGETQALKNIDLSVSDNEITALIGPSGCGKSTCLKSINRMNDLIPTVKTQGDIKYNGTSVFKKDLDVNELRRDIGMVF